MSVSVCDSRLRMVIHINGTPHWLNGYSSTDAMQRVYIATQDASGLGYSCFGEGMVYDAYGQHIARISYNGRLWPALPYHADMEPLAEAPQPTTPSETWHLFESADIAIAYRRENGTGGWIFAIRDTGKAILFPWRMTPFAVMNSALVKGQEGYFIGANDQYWLDRIRSQQSA